MEKQRDVKFNHPENLKRPIVLGFIENWNGERTGYRYCDKDGGEPVDVHKKPTDGNFLNVNFHGGRIDPKCCNLSDFPILTPKSGMDVTKLTAKNGGAWVVNDYGDGRFRLLSVSGQAKDVTNETAVGFHEKFKIANADVADGKLVAKQGFEFPSYNSSLVGTNLADIDHEDKFRLLGNDTVSWLFYNADANDGSGGFVENIITYGAVTEALNAINNGESEENFFDTLDSVCKRYEIDHDGSETGGERFVGYLKDYMDSSKYTLIGCTEETERAIYEHVGIKIVKEAATSCKAGEVAIPASESAKNDRFFEINSSKTGDDRIILWLTPNAYPDHCKGEHYGLTYLKRKEILAEADTDANAYLDFFDALETGAIIYGDGYAKVDKIYKTEEVFCEGQSAESMRKIIALAKGEKGDKPVEKQDSSKNAPKSLQDASGDGSQLIRKKMEKLNQELKNASEAYYNDREIMSDHDYDMKFDELRAMEAEHGVLLSDSVTQDVGASVSGKLPKVEHPQRLLSLDKTKDVGALVGLLETDGGADGVLAWKLDGLTVVANYKGGKFVNAVTRGNGKIGEDVTHNAKFFAGMPRRVAYTGSFSVRGEALISFSTFDKINNNLPDGTEPYKNPRNLASGTVRRSDVTKDGSVEFIAFNLVHDDAAAKNSNYLADLNWLRGQGFTVVEHYACNKDDVKTVVDKFKGKVQGYDKPTDGLVLTLNDIGLQAKLGQTGHHPKWAMAFKWADEKQTTKLLEIEWSASRNGNLTPVAIFEPVELEGTTVKRASVHNLTIMRELQLGIGDEISIYKANMIIPQIAENHTKSNTCKPPKNCPVCGADTEERQDGKSAFLFCSNPDCTAKNIGMLAHFCKRDAMNLDGVSDKIVEELVSHGFIKDAADFYSVKNYPEIAELPGWGKSSYNKLLYAIENSRKPRLPNFIYALGIKNVGRSASNALAEHFKSIEALMDAAANGVGQIKEVEGVGDGMAADIVDYFSRKSDFVRKLMAAVSIQNPGTAGAAVAVGAGVPQGKPGCLSGLTFCITGAVEFPGKRSAMQAYISSLGGKNASSVTKNVNYLITNDTSTGTKKNQDAAALGVSIISEQGFLTMVEDMSK